MPSLIEIVAMVMYLALTAGSAAQRDVARGACEISALKTRTAEFERELRASDPGMSAQELSFRLDRERPYLKAFASTDCT